MPDNDLNYQAIVEILAKQEKKDNEKRKKTDWVAMMPVILSLTSACITIFAGMLLSSVGPKRGSNWQWLTFFGQSQEAVFRWPKGPVNVAYVSLIVSMLLCVIAFICNKMRMRRKDDKYNVAVFVIGAITLISLVSFLVKFIPLGILG